MATKLNAKKHVESPPPVPSVLNTTQDMRRFLINQMTGVAEGTVNIAVAKGVSNLSQQIYNTMNMEIKHALAMQKLGDKPIPKVEF
jgi:hypothetical protein